MDIMTVLGNCGHSSLSNRGVKFYQGKCQYVIWHTCPAEYGSLLTPVFHASVLLLIINFFIGIVKVAVDPQNDSQLDLQ